MRPDEALAARIAAVAAHARAVEAWHAAPSAKERGRMFDALREALARDSRTRIDLDDAIATAARER